MARHTTVSRHLRIGVVALLGAGLFAPGLPGALHGIGATAVAQASTASADRGTGSDDGVATTSTPALAADPDRRTGADDSAATTSTPALAADPDRRTGADDSAATTSTPALAADPDRRTGADDQHVSRGRDGGSDDEGVSDEGAVHDGQFGQTDEPEVELHQEETNRVNAGSNAFSDDTTRAQNAPQADR